MYNKVVVVGNLTRDIELRYLPSGTAIAKSAIATSHKYKTATGEQKDEVCFLDFNMFGRSAEVANQYLKKGSKVLLDGRLVFEQWVAQDGSKRSRHTLRVNEMKMLGGRDDNNSGGYSAPSNQSNDSNGGDYGNDNTNGNDYGNQQNQNQYQQPQQNQNQYQQPQAQQPTPIPEIDIDEDEIPF
jgi:single-strand DNA-binding protein